MNYDLSVLNDKEFESLVIDLLTAELGVRVERFKAGKDEGIDGRWFTVGGHESILQCKHWPRTPLATLLREIRTKEKVKVDKLRPNQYVFACSTPLSPTNKNDILAAFSPHIKKASDVLGLEDIQDLLSKHGEVERRHYKLWLASSQVLVTLLNNDIFGRSDEVVSDLRQSLAKYVDTTESKLAREKIERTRVVIIKGEPGVGKTTLAKQLALESIASGFRLIAIERDIIEAERVFEPDTKQIFYFDDFLGRNFLEALDENKDSHIINFIRRVAKDENKRFVLTTRTHILDRGKQLSELFDHNKVGRREFELTVGGLTRLEKAQILYNHLWHSGLPPWAIDCLYEDQRYLQVVDHKNFNPRIISFITDPERIAGIDQKMLWKHIQDTLANPKDIWRHVFARQVGTNTRDLAVLVAFNGKPIEQAALEAAFNRFNGLSTDNPLQLGQRFYDALKLGVGSVLSRVVENNSARISLFNPSIADFVLHDSQIGASIPAVVSALQTADSVEYLSATYAADLVSESLFHSALLSVAANLSSAGIFSGKVACLVAENLFEQQLDDSDRGFCRAVANQITTGDFGVERGTLKVFVEAFCRGQISEEVAKLEELMGNFDRFHTEPGQLSLLRQAAVYFDQKYATTYAVDLREKVVNLYMDFAQEAVVESGVLDDLFDPSDILEAKVWVEQYVVSEFARIGFDLTASEVMAFVSAISYHDVIDENISSSVNEYPDDARPLTPPITDSVIVDYFDRSGAEPST